MGRDVGHPSVPLQQDSTFAEGIWHRNGALMVWMDPLIIPEGAIVVRERAGRLTGSEDNQAARRTGASRLIVGALRILNGGFAARAGIATSGGGLVVRPVL